MRRRYDLESELLRAARSDARGVPVCGREDELARLREVGARDASLGRIYEGHCNAVQLISRFGSSEQRASIASALGDGHIFGVWNTQADDEALRIEPVAGTFRLHGAKTWASGAGSITRPIVTATLPDGGLQMCVVPMDEVLTQIDDSAWAPLGMFESDSFRVCFDGVMLRAHDLIGEPGDYQRQPWFFGGALRFAAVQCGIVEAIVDDTISYLVKLGREMDPYHVARVAEMKIAARTAGLWLAAGAQAWTAFDDEPSAGHATAVLDVVDMARTVVERAALDVIERASRSVGARGLSGTGPLAGRIGDLQMYLRQPAPDAAIARVGRRAFEDSSNLRAVRVGSA